MKSFTIPSGTIPSGRRGLGAIFLVVASIAPALWARPAAGSPLDDKRAEAQRVARQLERQATRASILNERYDQARLNLVRVERSLAAARAAQVRNRERVSGVRDRLRKRAVDAYTQGGGLSRVAPLVAGDGLTLALRRQYLDTVAGDDRQALDDLRAAQEDLDVEDARLEQARETARAAQQALTASRKAAAAAVHDEQAMLARVRGELAQLVQAEQERRAAEAARRVQAELAARRARAAAAAAANDRATRHRIEIGPIIAGTSAGGSDGGGLADDVIGSAPSSAGAGSAVAEAQRQLGKPYDYGGDGPGSFDCSGLTAWVWRAAGVSLPHSSEAQWSATTHVSPSDMQPGDLAFFGHPIHHVGVYVGGGMMIEASHAGAPVRYSSVYRRDLVGIGRPG